MSNQAVLNNILANIKGTQNSHFKLKIKYIKTFLSIAYKLLEYGCITHYTISKGYIYIYKNIISNLMISQIPKHLMYKKFYDLESLMHKNPTAVYIVLTSTGIVDNVELRKLKIGGSLLFIIKYKSELHRF